MSRILYKKFMQDPKQELEPKSTEKQDPDSKKIIQDPQQCLDEQLSVPFTYESPLCQKYRSRSRGKRTFEVIDIVPGEGVAHSRKCEKEMGMDRIRIRNFPPGRPGYFRSSNDRYEIVKMWYQYCSTTGKPTRSFATERVSLDSV